MSQYVNLRTGGIITTRRDFGKGLAAIISAGVAPSIALGLAGSANASVGCSARGMMRGVGGRLAAMGGGLPYDAEVEYLQSDGNSWILTDLTGNGAMSYEVKAIPVNFLNSEFVPVGSWTAWVNKMYGDDMKMTQFLTCYGSLTNNGSGSTSRMTGSSYVTIYYTPTQSHWVSSNGVNFYWNHYSQSFDNGIRVCLFGLALENERYIVYRPSARIWYVKFKLGGNVISDIIPVRVGSGSSAVGYMFDRISGKLLGNAGSGKFTVGPDKT